MDKEGTPLALLPEFKDNPNAMFVIWKDHTAVKEADEINRAAKTWGGEDYTKYEGGVYSSEWFWAKILHVLRDDEKIREKAFSWVEHCDWVPALLTGNTDPLKLKRSRCAAGHKAMWHKSFGGLPAEEFLKKIDPLLTGLRERLFKETYASDVKVGNLSFEWAQRLGLSPETAVGVGAFDAHMGAVGAGIEPYVLTKVMGTSTCDMLVAPLEELGDKLIKGICGQVDGSIIPGMLGMEAGQSAFGDVYAWFKRLLTWPLEKILRGMDIKNKEEIEKKISHRILPELTKEAERIPVNESTVLALDWLNGRRTPYANQLLKGAIAGLNLGSDAPKIFRALIEATAFGAKKIVERFEEEGIRIKSVIALGGVPKKSPFIVQVMADVLNMKIKVSSSEQACALGAAMFAATACGIHKRVEEAQGAMGSGFEKEYTPEPKNAEKYKLLYSQYERLGEFVESTIVA